MTLPKSNRTLQQNKSLHKYCELVADELNEAGFDIKIAIKADVPWNKDRVKDLWWRELQKAQFGKKSTTQLTTLEIQQVYETMNRSLAGLGIHIAWPSLESLNQLTE